MPVSADIYSLVQPPPSTLSQLSGLQQVQSQGLQIKQQQLQMQAQQALDQAYAGAVTKDENGNPKIDENALFSHLPGHLIPGAMEGLTKIKKNAADLQETQAKVQGLHADLLGNLASTVQAAGNDPQTFIRGLRLAQSQGIIDGPTATQYAMHAIEGGPDAVKQITDQVIAGSAKQRELITAATAANARMLGANKPTEASLAVSAAGGNANAQKAIDVLKASKGTAEQDDQRYRNIQASLVQKQPVPAADLAWARGYEKQKTLGPEASAAAAADRQATTIAQQTAQQGRAQAFAEGQAGRKEYTDKVATPYQTALASAQTMRDTVAAAQSGNKVAANLQNLETAMSAIRAQGLNRINTTEIGVAANAGSLWDRIQGRIGALVAGKPVPADLQKDMLQFADILEKSATMKYQKGRSSLQQVYPGAKLPDESVTPSAPGGAGVNVTAPNGKVYRFTSQADADAAVAKAKAAGLWK